MVNGHQLFYSNSMPHNVSPSTFYHPIGYVPPLSAPYTLGFYPLSIMTGLYRRHSYSTLLWIRIPLPPDPHNPYCMGR